MEIKDVIPIACDGLPHQNILFENDLSVIIKMRDTMENTLLNARATLPSYDRSKLVSRIVHLGFGAFHRAHQAVYADILAAEHGSHWGYTEVNLIGGEQQIADLQQQDLLYTVAEMSADAWTARVVGVVKQAIDRKSVV